MPTDLGEACSCLRESVPAVVDKFSGRYGRIGLSLSPTSTDPKSSLHGETASHSITVTVLDESGQPVEDERWYRAILGLCLSEFVLNGGEWEQPVYSHISCPYNEDFDAKG